MKTNIFIDTIRYYVSIADVGNEVLQGWKYIRASKYYINTTSGIHYIYYRNKGIMHIIIDPKKFTSLDEMESSINNNLIFGLSYKELKLSRIDYTMDMVCQSANQVKEYLEVFAHLKEYKFFKKKIYKDTIYLNSKSTSIKIYDKHVESNGIYNNTIRLEISMLRSFFRNQLKTFGRCDELFNYFDEDARISILQKYIQLIIHTGNFMPIAAAKKIVNLSNYKADYKKKLIKFLIDYKIKDNKELRKKYSGYSRLVMSLDEMNINPITTNTLELSNPFQIVVLNVGTSCTNGTSLDISKCTNAPIPEEEYEMYTLQEVADALQIPLSTVRLYVREGKLEATKVGRYYMVKAISLNKLINTVDYFKDRIDEEPNSRGGI